MFDLAKMADRKKKLEQICVTIDESEKRLEKYKADLLQWISSLPPLDDETLAKVKEEPSTANFDLLKRFFALRKESALDFIQLFNFLSIRFGTYKLINNKKQIEFSSEIEYKLFATHVEKIKNLIQEEENLHLPNEQPQAAAKLEEKAEKLDAKKKDDDRSTIAEATAKDGAKIEIKIENLEHSIFEVNGKGFKPHEPLHFISNNPGFEVVHLSITADKDGNIVPIGMGMQPALMGAPGGVCHIDILREEGPIHIKLPWGTEALKKR
jgi:hypothetical protein